MREHKKKQIQQLGMDPATAGGRLRMLIRRSFGIWKTSSSRTVAVTGVRAAIRFVRMLLMLRCKIRAESPEERKANTITHLREKHGARAISSIMISSVSIGARQARPERSVLQRLEMELTSC